MQRFKGGVEASAERRQDPLRLATAAILLDIAYADGTFTPAEDGDIVGFLKRVFALGENDASLQLPRPREDAVDESHFPNLRFRAC